VDRRAIPQDTTNRTRHDSTSARYSARTRRHTSARTRSDRHDYNDCRTCHAYRAYSTSVHNTGVWPVLWHELFIIRKSQMSYPAPTQPLHPEKPKYGTPPQQLRAQYTTKGDTFVPYPAPTTGVNVAVRFAPIAPVTIYAGQTHQLLPTLQDVTGATQQPTERITYRSNNLQIPVSENGLVITACNPPVFSRKGSSVHGNIQINHDGINILVDVTVVPYVDSVVSD
jgi:hypothetical protein